MLMYFSCPSEFFSKERKKLTVLFFARYDTNVCADVLLFCVIAISIYTKTFIKMHLLPFVHIIGTHKVVPS